MKKSLVSVMVAVFFGIALNGQDATRGGTLYKQQCASCHGEGLQGRNGPPLAGAAFLSKWPAAAMIDKIRNTMPLDNPGKLTGMQAADLAAYVQQAGQGVKTAPATTSAAGPPQEFPPLGNLSQLMRGVMF